MTPEERAEKYIRDANAAEGVPEKYIDNACRKWGAGVAQIIREAVLAERAACASILDAKADAIASTEELASWEAYLGKEKAAEVQCEAELLRTLATAIRARPAP